MNIAYFLTPKAEVTSLYDDNSFRKGLEMMREGNYSVVPVLTRDFRYYGAVSMADFFWYLCDEIGEDGTLRTRPIKGVLVRDIMKKDTHPPVSVTSSLEQLLERILQSNFVPVVDDRGVFIGIVTRHNVMEYLKNHNIQ